MIDDILTISECGVAAVAMNATVNTFIETKKLKLKHSKCSAIHVGKKSNSCPDLKVHGQKMHREESVKYLGDIVHKSGKSKENTSERVVKANAIVAEIRAILADIPLGKYRTQVGVQLRQAMFLNGVLFNSEVWPELPATEIASLEAVDLQLIRTICQAHAKTPKEFLYLETGCAPLKYVISSRRLMYLHHIVNRENTELIKRIYNTQKTNTTKGDFVELVDKDLKLLGEGVTEESMKTISKQQLKKWIKESINDVILNEMKEKQKQHTKTRNIEYTKFELQEYMKDKNMSNSMVTTLFALRSSMVRGVRGNFVSSSVRTLSATCWSVPFSCPG